LLSPAWPEAISRIPELKMFTARETTGPIINHLPEKQKGQPEVAPTEL
jgi:hypothetical protein